MSRLAAGVPCGSRFSGDIDRSKRQTSQMNTLLAPRPHIRRRPARARLFAGDWEPYSNAFVGLRMLSIGKDTLSWKGCKDVHFDVLGIRRR